MTQFRKIEPNKLYLSTGQLFDPQGNLITPEISDFSQEMNDLKQKGYSLDQIRMAIESHPEIKNKEILKRKAEDLFKS